MSERQGEMTDYISREAFIKWAEETYCKPCEADGRDYNHCRCGACQYDDMMRDAESFPAADVRPVVLCRDCKYSYDSVGGWCCSHGICVDCIVREDFFCADGEKREES